jgi:hypothetical protein
MNTTTDPTSIKTSSRNIYSDEVKALVKLTYPACRNEAEKLVLAAELGICDSDGNPAVWKLYNLASRLGASGQSGKARASEIYDASEDRARLFLRENPSTARPFSTDEDAFIHEHFPNEQRLQWLPIETIGARLNRSETAIAYRTRQLNIRGRVHVPGAGSYTNTRPLRRIPQLWDWRKVSAFLGVAPALRPLSDPITDPLAAVRATERQLRSELRRRPTLTELTNACEPESAPIAKFVNREERLTQMWDELCATTEPEEDGRPLPVAAFGYDIDTVNRQRQLGVHAAYKSGKLTLDEARTLARSLVELATLELHGLTLSPCTDCNGKPTITVVSTLSLLRALDLDRPATCTEGRPSWQRLLEDNNADRYFLDDMRESLVLIRDNGRLIGEGCWEPWRWMSHGGTSLCPFAPESFGLVPDEHDFKLMASPALLFEHDGRTDASNRTPKPGYQLLDADDLHPHAHCERDGWTRRSPHPTSRVGDGSVDEVQLDTADVHGLLVA